MSSDAQLLIAKFRQMDEELRFLNDVWRRLDQKTRDRMLNNYSGRVPGKFKK